MRSENSLYELDFKNERNIMLKRNPKLLKIVPGTSCCATGGCKEPPGTEYSPNLVSKIDAHTIKNHIQKWIEKWNDLHFSDPETRNHFLLAIHNFGRKWLKGNHFELRSSDWGTIEGHLGGYFRFSWIFIDFHCF